MFTWKRCVLAGLGFISIALLFLVLILPGIARDQAQRWVKEETGRTLEIGSISVNPFSLTIAVRELQLSDADPAKPFVSWSLLRVSLSPASLYHRALVIDELHIDQPDIRLERLTAERFNFSDLIPQQDNSAPAEATGEPTRFSINNVSISGGRIDLVDSSLEQEVHHTIRNLQLVLPAIGNLPYMVENPAQPMFQAEINDSPFHLAGQLKPFTSIQEMQFDLELENIDLPFYLGYIPLELPVELSSGKLSLDLDIRYRISAEAGGELELSGKVDLASLDIKDRTLQPLFFLPLMRIEIAPSQPLKQELHLTALRVYNLEVQLNRDSRGIWNHSRMAPAGEDNATPAASGDDKASPFRLTVDTLEIHDGVVFFEDALPAGGFRTVARDINIDVKDFTLDAGDGMPLRLSLETDRKETLAVNGRFQLMPFGLSVQTELRNIALGAYEPYYRDTYAGALGGKLELQARLSTNPEQPLLVSDGKVQWRDAYLAFNEQEGLGIALVDISDLSFDLGQNRLAVGSAGFADGRVNFSRSKAGHWSFLSRNFPILAKLAEASSEKPEPAVAKEGPEFSYAIGELTLKNWAIDVNDHLPATPARLAATDFNLTINNLAAPEKVESPLAFSTVFQRRGRVDIKGTVSLADQSARLNTRLKRIPLASFAPYVAEQANLVLADGYLDARLSTAVDAGSEPLKIAIGGDVGVSKFHLLDSRHREDLLKWDSLQLAGVEARVEPLAVVVKSITLSDYFAKVLIDEEARLNLVEAFSGNDPQAPAEETAAVQETETSVAAAPSAEASAPPDIRIDTVILQGGRVDFTDRNLPRPFHADMRELGGRIEGLSSSADSLATVDLRGSLRNQSPMTISGTVNPLAEKLFLDLKLNFTDIELSPLSPYSGNYVGYLIDKGKLNLSLEYFIENDELKAKNKVFLDQFTFGDKVESEQATSLPVKLAVALLKDRNGEIHLDIPVYGALDDPQFSIAGVVWTVIKNLLVKAATSPLALLGALVGGGEEDFGTVVFDYGSTRLTAAEEEKLSRLSQALADRPSLKVEVKGYVDPESDPEGYRKEVLAGKVRQLAYLDMVKRERLPEGADAENLVVPAEDYADYLWEVYSEADFPKPRNFIGMTKKLPVAEMEKLLYANTTVDQNTLAELALARAVTVQNYLTGAGALAKERVFLTRPEITAEPENKDSSRARVELDTTVN